MMTGKTKTGAPVDYGPEIRRERERVTDLARTLGHVALKVDAIQRDVETIKTVQQQQGVLLGGHSATLKSHSEILNHHSEVLNHHSEVLNHHSEILNHHSEILNHHSAVLDSHTATLAEHSTRFDRLETMLGQVLSAQAVAVQNDMELNRKLGLLLKDRGMPE